MYIIYFDHIDTHFCPQTYLLKKNNLLSPIRVAHKCLCGFPRATPSINWLNPPQKPLTASNSSAGEPLVLPAGMCFGLSCRAKAAFLEVMSSARSFQV